MDTQSDHPRIRGEHWRRAWRWSPRMGSSPHTRGAHSGLPEGIRMPGIIPAYAGSTGRRWHQNRCSRDHPRIRGEHDLSRRLGFGAAGSSPHTRGALGRAAGEADPVGIIPAYAGSTVGFCFRVAVGDGSSPHTRGAPLGDRDRRREDGIIPAYAGSTPGDSCRLRFFWDHPRIRGEHPPVLAVAPIRTGSSPHTRGALSAHTGSRSTSRIIPAYAGSTEVGAGSSWDVKDHPRIRGEHPPGIPNEF